MVYFALLRTLTFSFREQVLGSDLVGGVVPKDLLPERAELGVWGSNPRCAISKLPRAVQPEGCVGILA